jgi:protein-disulfide isomerase
VRGALLVFAFVLVGSASSCAAPLPQVIKDEMAVTQARAPGSTTLVFFTDFQCPFCRRTHAALAPLLAERRVRLVLRHVPLPRHPDARSAARAAVCVEAIVPEKTLSYAHALFTAPDIGEGACEEMAIALGGIDRDVFRRCLSDPTTDQRIDRDIAMYEAVGGDGVPLLFVGKIRLEGMQSRSSLEAALDAEK